MSQYTIFTLMAMLAAVVALGYGIATWDPAFCFVASACFFTVTGVTAWRRRHQPD